MLVLSLLACAKQTPVEPSTPETKAQAREAQDAPERAHARKAGAPVELDARLDAERAVITASFTGAGTDVELSAWGASGLTVPGENLRWTGKVDEGETITVELEHEGGGDLAVRVVGTFAGERMDEVRSWTVGRREKTPVPVQNGSKGWDATRR